MSAITNLPSELHTDRIIPLLTAEATWAFVRSSKAAYGIVIAAAQLSQKDITLSGEKAFVVSKTMSAFLRQQMKMDILFKSPSLFSHLRPIRAAVKEAGGDPDDVLALYNRASNNASKAMPVIALFDFNTQKIPTKNEKNYIDLMRSLTVAIQSMPELVRAVLAHPDAVDLSVDGFFSLGHVLGCAAAIHNPKNVRAILSLANAAKIPLEGRNSLEEALTAAKGNNITENEKAITDFLKKTHGKH